MHQAKKVQNEYWGNAPCILNLTKLTIKGKFSTTHWAKKKKTLLGQTANLKVMLKETRQATYVRRNIAARSRNHCYRGTAISITYSESVFVALSIHHAKRLNRVILLSVVCPALPYLSTLSQKQHDFRRKKKKQSNINCVEIKMPTRCNRWFFITKLIVRSTCFGHHYAHHQELKSIIQVVAACDTLCYGLQLQHPANRTHNLKFHTTPTTSRPKHQVPQVATTCIILLSSWWWA